MRILYGVQTTGNGHISRSREVVRELKALGHDVRTVLTGRDPSQLREMEIFEPSTSLRGLSFATRAGKVNLLETARHAPFDLRRMHSDVASFDASGVDLIVCDFEPVTARVARKRGIPSIGVGHQYAFVYDVPLVPSDPVSRYILRNMAPVDIPLGLHWSSFGQPILPPIVPDGMLPSQTVENKILVYLPFESNTDIVATLAPITSHDFYIYGTREPEGDRANLHHRAYSRGGFLSDLTDCNGVICNAGFELPSEALQLGKRLLVKPLYGQLEQKSNALALTQLKLGTMAEALTTEAIDSWLRTAPPVQPANYPETAREIAKWIDTGEWGKGKELAEKLWAGTRA